MATNARGDVTMAYQVGGMGTSGVVEEQQLDIYGEKAIYQRAVAPNFVTCVQGKENNGYSHAEQTCSTAVLMRFGIAGGREHARTKLVDFRARTYATHLKSFLQKDPLGNIDSEGMFNYAVGDPVNLRDPWGTTATQEPAVGQSTEPDYNGQTPTTSNDANSYREAGGYGGHQEIPGPLPGRDGAMGGGPSQNAPDVGNPLGAVGEIMIGADQGIDESIGESLEGIGNFAADPIGSITRLDADLTDAAAGIARELYDDGPTAAGNSLGEAIGKAASDLYNEASTNNGAGNLFGRGLVEIAKVLVGAGVARAASAVADKVGDLTTAAKVADKSDDVKDAGKKADDGKKGGKASQADERVTVTKQAPSQSEIRETNPKHHENSPSPEPRNVDDLWKNSVVDSKGRRWAKDDNGVVHRFSPPSNGKSHWNGSTEGPQGIPLDKIPAEVKDALGVKR